MVYQGSKSKIARYIIPIMTQFLNGDNYFIDAFCGGCNLIDKIEYDNRIANDINRYLISLFKYVVNGGKLPMYISKEEYYEIKNNKEKYPDWYVGFCGFICSWRGKFFDGYLNNKYERDYQKEHINNFINQIPHIQNIQFKNTNYFDLFVPDKSVIYCDPPYLGTKRYMDKLEHELFWNICRKWTEKGHFVFISEYKAPTDFIQVWSKKMIKSIPTGGTSDAAEKLFVHEKLFNKVNNNLFK